MTLYNKSLLASCCIFFIISISSISLSAQVLSYFDIDTSYLLDYNISLSNNTEQLLHNLYQIDVSNQTSMNIDIYKTNDSLDYHLSQRQNLSLSKDLYIVGYNDVIIDGNIVGKVIDQPNTDGQNLIIYAKGKVQINGNISLSDGGHAIPFLENEAMTESAFSKISPKSFNASLLSVGSMLPFQLNKIGSTVSLSGGNGGTLLVIANEVEINGEIQVGNGGNGLFGGKSGKGGDVIFFANDNQQAVQIKAGNGGGGGKGGNGGDAMYFFKEPKNIINRLSNCSINAFGGHGGHGGNAANSFSCTTAGTNGINRSARGNVTAGNGGDGTLGCSGGNGGRASSPNASGRGGNGGRGGSGVPTSSRGGEGGSGGHGGDGLGGTQGTGGFGGNGGAGANALNGNRSGKGGPGGDGGNGTGIIDVATDFGAHGRGSDGGEGGSGSYSGGDGGNGGDGIGANSTSNAGGQGFGGWGLSGGRSDRAPGVQGTGGDGIGGSSQMNIGGEGTGGQPNGRSINGGSFLPVMWGEIKISNKSNHILIEWETLQELNNKGFGIERSIDGRQWKQIGFITGNGDSNETKHYFFIDQAPLVTTSYYRIAQLDFDGKRDHSPTLIANKKYKTNQLLIYPNPATMQIKTPQSKPSSSYFIYNTRGQLVKEGMSRNDSQIEIATLPKGLYWLQIIDKAEVLTGKNKKK